MRARFFVCEAISLFTQGLSLRGRLFASEAVSPFGRSLRARRFACEAISSSAALRLLRSARSDKKRALAITPIVSLQGRRFVCEAVSTVRSHCEPRFFALFLCHCEVVVPLPKQSLQIASLRSQRQKIPPDCFASLAMTHKGHCEVVVSEAVSLRAPRRGLSTGG